MPAFLLTLLAKGAEVAITLLVESAVSRWLKAHWRKRRKPH
jgi:hypothetical protein